MLRRVYTFLFYLSLPLLLSRLWWRGKKNPGYRQRIKERFGFVKTPGPGRPVICLHSVSVGESIAAAPLIEAILADGRFRLWVTTTTPTGSERVQAMFGTRILHSYLPYDLPCMLKRFFKRSGARQLIIMETELWPNLLRSCYLMGIDSYLVNARLSQKSAEGYARFSKTTSTMLNQLSGVAAQQSRDAERFEHLGLAPNKLQVCGNIKFDLEITDALKQKAKALKQQLSAKGQYQILIAASTHKGEDEIILQAFKQCLAQNKNLRLVLAPRHPERFDEVYKLCASMFKTLRRSEQHEALNSDEFEILCADTMGELMLFYGACDMAFIGGSLVERGGHNMIEPAYWGCPTLSGPHVFNFQQVAEEMQQQGALTFVEDANTLAEACNQLIRKPALRLQQGLAAQKYAQANKGACQKIFDFCLDKN